MVFGFSPAEFEILDYVMANYSHMPIDEFIGDVVKETDPFQAVTIQGHRLPMELVDNRKRTEVGFNLEAIIRAEMQAAEGASITLTQLRDEIHASHPA